MRLVVGIADMKLSTSRGDQLITHALGSCLGITVFDPVAGVGGMLHVMLPQSSIDPEKATENPHMFVDSGVPRLFIEAYKLGAQKSRMHLKVAGGASTQGIGDEDYFPPPETMGGWRANLSPEFVRSRGLDPAALEDLGRFSQSIRNSAWPGYDYHHHTATIVIKDGWIVGEWYSLPETRFFQQYLASNGKSFAYLLFGVLVKESRERQARVQFTEQSRVYDPTYLQEGFPLSDPRKAEITFEQ